MFQRSIQSLDSLQYFRCKNLAIFSLFHLSKIDIACFLACIEHIDKDYSQRINIATFSEIFCPTWKHTFQILFKRFIILFSESRSKNTTLLPSLPLSSTQQHQQQQSQQTHGIKKKETQDLDSKDFDFTATYTELLSFLFFIISIDDLSSPFWLYWLWFTLPPKIKITKPLLIDLIDLLWGPLHTKQSKEHRILLKPIIKYLEPDDFDSKKFQLVDWRCHCGYSTPINSMRRELMTMIGGTNEFWKRVKCQIHEVIENPFLVIERLGRKKEKFLTPSHRKSRVITRNHWRGERREGWFELRDFIEYFLQFHEAIRADPPQPKGALGRLVFAVSKQVQFTVDTMKSILPSSTHLPADKQKGKGLELLREESAEGGIPDDNSLTKLYRKSLKLSVKRLREMSDRRREVGREGLARCEEELGIKIDYGEEEKQEGEGEGGKDEEDEEEEEEVEEKKKVEVGRRDKAGEKKERVLEEEGEGEGGKDEEDWEEEEGEEGEEEEDDDEYEEEEEEDGEAEDDGEEEEEVQEIE
jgi:hypothetical protein